MKKIKKTIAFGLMLPTIFMAASCGNSVTNEDNNKKENNSKNEDVLGTSSALAFAYMASSAEKRAAMKTIYTMAQDKFDQLLANSVNSSFLTTDNKAVYDTSTNNYGNYKMSDFDVQTDVANSAYKDNSFGDKEVPTVVIDLDETVLDNAPYEAYLLMNHKSYSPASFAQWVSLGQAPIYPGVIDFVKHVYEKGGVVLFDSDRDQLNGYQGTKKSLENFGYPAEFNKPENYWMKGVEKDVEENVNRANGKGIAPFLKAKYGIEDSNVAKYAKLKEARYQYLNDMTKYQIVMNIGDNLDDFIKFGSYHMSNEKRLELASSENVARLWGGIADEVRFHPVTHEIIDPSDASIGYVPNKQTFIQITNTSYGGWEGGLAPDYFKLSSAEKVQKRIDAAHPKWLPAWNGQDDWNSITSLSETYKKFITFN